MNDDDGRREPRYVGFWRRAFASLVDTVLLLALLAPVAFVFFGGALFRGEAEVGGVGGAVLNYVLPFAIVMLFWRTNGATPGKMLIGATIVDAETGGAPSLGQHVIRYLGYYVSGLVLGLGFLWVAFDGRKQGWHDKLARTLVVERGR